ncbi:MAG: 1-acyl-sn-glycerol-3-phosphate acyltransferase [Chlamydiia bacterium]|nr:1-acyl-sn-glycerol-3-phosphate acyltransferase [Chlamydiia bacterium]MCP5509341.1 1-acyl-sn-glycerol-3-phosphate acyltransferase [Chlamydiales bacterium]HPE84613.1 lysophospholipid acyltransferase family protein [Chlamydiales bacterium]
MPKNKSKSTPVLYKIVILVVKIFFKLVYRHKVYGLENFVSGCGIIAANHVSFYDPPLIAVSAPEEIHFLARKTLFDHKIFGAFIQKLNSHPVSGGAGDASVLRTILKLLKQGNKVLLFPEGTRREGELGEIREGLGLLAYKSGCPIIPAYILGADAVWPRSRKFPKLWGKTAVIFGKPIDPEAFSHLERREAQKAIAAAFTTAINKLSQQYTPAKKR